MKFSDAFLDEIRDRLPISEVVGKRVSFDKKKTNQAKGDYWACCPFHGEKSPSFHCEDRKGRYHCFGCGVSGDHFRFLVELDGLNFPEAVERLADMAGVAMPVYDQRERERDEQRASLHDVMEIATKFFEEQLQSPAGAKARSYLRDRGLSAKIQNEFRIGFAPESRNALKQFLAEKNVTAQQMEATGMVVHGEDIAVSYDRFRDRIMFPIPDSRGRIIAFGGRALSPDALAKYLNSPETELFHKSNVLYNYAKARGKVHDKGQVIVAEGYMDVIALHAAGFANSVAPLGTALTERQMLLLWRIVPEPLLCFDGDGAGLKAAFRSIDMMLAGLEPGRSARFALLPEGLDPDDLIRLEGPEAMQQVLASAIPLADMIWKRETENGVYETPEKRAELEARIKSVVALIRHESVRRHYDQEMRDRLANFFGNGRHSNSFYSVQGGGKSTRLKQGFGNAGSSGRGQAGSGKLGASTALLNSSMMKKGRAGIPLREAALIMGIINHPALLGRYFDEFAELPLSSQLAMELRQQLIDLFALRDNLHDEPMSAAWLVEQLTEKSYGDVMERMSSQLKQNRIWQAEIEAAFEDALDGWRQAYLLHIKSHTLHRELKAAEMALAEDGTEENLERFLQIQSELSREDGIEAIIDGFGVPSGRPNRSV